MECWRLRRRLLCCHNTNSALRGPLWKRLRSQITPELDSTLHEDYSTIYWHAAEPWRHYFPRSTSRLFLAPAKLLNRSFAIFLVLYHACLRARIPHFLLSPVAVWVCLPSGKYISSSRPDRFWGPPSLLSNGYRGIFLLGYNGRGVKLTTSDQWRGKKNT
jgi:hypothetical protein